ncbi:MAG: gamma-glutamylcyclotransferase [Spirochaetes bacterium]|nr:gamma-glutamylcyclotransferase [Spirochaetota bacterium]
MTAYFAYGSNMDQEDLDRFCREQCGGSFPARAPGVAELKDYALSFNYYSGSRKGGAANIMASPGDLVYGLLFEVNEEEFEMIARKEGAPNFYETIDVLVTVGGEDIRARTFKVAPERETAFTEPTREYMDIIIAAAEAHRFPAWYLDRLRDIPVPGPRGKE